MSYDQDKAPPGPLAPTGPEAPKSPRNVKIRVEAFSMPEGFNVVVGVVAQNGDVTIYPAAFTVKAIKSRGRLVLQTLKKYRG